MNTERPGTPVHQRPTKQAQARTTHRGEREREMLDDNDALYSTRIPNSVRRYDTEQPEPEQQVRARPRFDVDVHQDYQLGTRIPPRRSRVEPPPSRREAPAPTREQQRHAPPRKKGHTWTWPRLHPMLYIGLTMCACVVLWIGVSTLFTLGSELHDWMTYGYPRTYQCDAVVGHDDSPSHPSHFIALNLHNHIEVIELPGGDATHMKVYLGPVLMGQGQDLMPVTLTLQDVNGDGKPDMLMHEGGNVFIWLNTGSTFRPATNNDHVTL